MQPWEEQELRTLKAMRAHQMSQSQRVRLIRLNQKKVSEAAIPFYAPEAVAARAKVQAEAEELRTHSAEQPRYARGTNKPRQRYVGGSGGAGYVTDPPLHGPAAAVGTRHIPCVSSCKGT